MDRLHLRALLLGPELNFCSKRLLGKGKSWEFLNFYRDSHKKADNIKLQKAYKA